LVAQLLESSLQGILHWSSVVEASSLQGLTQYIYVGGLLGSSCSCWNLLCRGLAYCIYIGGLLGSSVVGVFPAGDSALQLSC
jgi:hypothetical protein